MSKEVTTQTNLQALSGFLKSDKISAEMEKVLGRNSSAFVTSALTAIGSNDMLKSSEKSTVYGAIMTAASMNLPITPSLGLAYLVPFSNRKKGVVECQFQIGYKGLKQLAIRSGKFRNMYAKKVYEGQMIEDDSFLGYHFKWGDKKSNKVVGYASYFLLVNGFESTFFMSTKELKDHGLKYSQSYKSEKTRPYSLWTTDFDKMAIKTVTKLHLNSGEAPLSIEMQNAINNDQAVISANEEGETIDVDYVDNQTLSIDQTQEAQERERLINFIKGAKSLDQLKQVESEVPTYELEEMYFIKFEELKQ